MSSLYGKVLSVETRNLGEPAVADASIGATTLYVADAATFDENGGFVTVNGEQLAYTSIDADLDTITLTNATVTAIADQDLVEVYPQAPIKTALVSFGGDGDPLPATVPHTLKDRLPDGTRTDATAETVTLEQRGTYEYVVTDISAEDVATTSLDYVEAESGVGISDTVTQLQDVNIVGQIGGTAASFDTINLGGVPLTDVLAQSSIGKLISARLPQLGASISLSTTKTKIMELNCGIVPGGRTYRIKSSFLLSSTGTLALTDRVTFTYQYTIDGTAPTTASAAMDGGFNDNYTNMPSAKAFTPEAEVDVATGGPLRVGLSAQVISGGGAYTIYAGSAAGSRPVMSLYDDGPLGARQDAAISTTTGGVSRYVKTYNAIWSFGADSSYGNALYNSYLYIGGEADQYGAVGFDSASMVAQLAGATTPVSCVLRWKPRSRRTADGLDIKLATHNFSSSTTAAAPSGGLPYFAYSNLASYGLTLLSNARNNAVPGTLYDESLGTTIFNQFKAGTRKGVAFLGAPQGSVAGGEGSVYGDGAYQCQLIFTYDGTS